MCTVRRVAVTEYLGRLGDAQLMDRVRGGDHAAYAALMDRHATIALAVAFRVVRDRDLAEDARQNAFLAAWLERERFDPVRGSARAWLLTIVARRALDQRRRPGVLAEPPPETLETVGAAAQAVAGLELEAVRREEARLVRRLVRRLPADQARAIELVYLLELSRPEAAALLGVSPSTLKGRLRLGLEQLRRSSGASVLARPDHWPLAAGRSPEPFLPAEELNRSHAPASRSRTSTSSASPASPARR